MCWESTITNWVIFLDYYSNSTINFEVEKIET
jgi:hypothetical protein